MPPTVATSQIAEYDAAFARVMHGLRLDQAPGFITALSGGADSTALACLADRYAKSRGIAHQAVIVNHNIRNHAKSEAERVCRRMMARAINTKIVTIQNKAPASGIQEWARHHRFAALTKLARKSRAVLLVAHHQADQAETILMRLAKGSGVAGLAGMRPLTQREAVLVARPLLAWSRDTLCTILAQLACDYEDDPSNQNSYFERVRVRRAMQASRDFGYPTVDKAVRLGRAMAALTDQLDAASLAGWTRAVRLFPSGYAIIDTELLQDLPWPVWHQRIRRLIRQIGGRSYGVSADTLCQLRSRIFAGLNVTAGGCQFVKSTRPGTDHMVYVVRERGRRPAVLDVQAGDDVIFAGCWRMQTAMAGQLMDAGGLEKVTGEAPGTLLPPSITALPHIVRRTIPVLYTLDGAVIYPQLEEVNTNVTSTGTALSAQFLGRENCFYENTTSMTG